MEKYILTLDLGTTNIKFVIFNSRLEQIAFHSLNFPLDTEASLIEFDAEDYWRVCKDGMKQLITKASIDSEKIISISLSSQAETLVILDKEGKPVRNAISWLDTRSTNECKILADSFNNDEAYKITGQPKIIPTWPVTKILWLKNNEKNNFNKVFKFLLLKDYIIYKLTGRFISDYTIYNFSYYFNITKKKYWKEILEFVSIDEEKLPELVEAGACVGNLLLENIKDFNFCSDIVLNVGSLDQMAAMIGMGNIEKGKVSESTGTVLAIGTVLEEPFFNKYRIPCHYNAIRDTYILLSVCESGGICLEWFKKNFEDNKNYSYLDGEIKDVDLSSNDLLFLPYITGANSPEFNWNAKGVFYGIELFHQKKHFLKAVFEGEAYLIRKNINIFERLGIKVEKIISSGGGSKSEIWNQIKSDINGKTVATVEFSEAASMGAAILASVEAGLYKSIGEAVKHSVQIKKTYAPENTNIYNRKYELFLDVYDRLFKTCF